MSQASRNDICISAAGCSIQYRIRYQEIAGNKSGWYIYQQNAGAGQYWHVWQIASTLAEAFDRVSQTF